MCFTKLWEVDVVENPHHTEVFKLYKAATNQCFSTRGTMEMIIRAYVRNKIVMGALEAAKGLEVKVITPEQKITTDWERAVVVCDVKGLRLLAPEGYDVEQIYQSVDDRLKNKVLVFQLNDFSCFAQFSVDFVENDALEEGVIEHAVVSVKHNFDIEQGLVYEITPEAAVPVSEDQGIGRGLITPIFYTLE